MAVDQKIVVVGTRVNCGLYYAGPGVIYKIKGEQEPDTIKSLSGGVGVMGGRADFGVVFENGSKSEVPEAIVRGIQWEIYDEVATAEEIEALLKNADQVAEAKAKQAKAEKEAFTAAVEKMRNNPVYAHLTQTDQTQGQAADHSGKLAAKNMRAALKKSFPGVTFSVRKTSYGSVSVNWTDGPVCSVVESLVLRHKTGHFDSMEDLATSEDTPFSVVFGGADYVHCHRETSDALIERSIDAVFNEYAGNLRDTAKPTAADFKRGALIHVEVPGIFEPLQRLIHKALASMPA